MKEPTKRRRSIRLRNYDYSQYGAYFISICCDSRRSLFGKVINAEMKQTELGEFAERQLAEICSELAHILLDYYVTVPNHLHAVLWLNSDVELKTKRAKHGFAPTTDAGTSAGTQSKSLQSFVQADKSSVTRQARKIGIWNDRPLWQRNYFEHVIRDDDALCRIRNYIINNPLSWQIDRENPRRLGTNEFYSWIDKYGRQAGRP